MSSARKRSAVLRAKEASDLERQKTLLTEHYAAKCRAIADIAIAQRNEAMKALGEIALHIAPYRYTNPDMHGAITACIDRVTNPAGENDVNGGSAAPRPGRSDVAASVSAAAKATVVTAGETAPISMNEQDSGVKS